MTRFTLTGQRGTRASVNITWEDGALSGDADAVAMVRDLAEGFEGQTLGQPGGPYTTHDHLTSPYSARELMCMVFANIPRQEGALPLLPDPPKGAIR